MKKYILIPLILIISGCASHPLRIDDKTWQSMSSEQKLEATKKQADINASERAERARHEAERRKRQDAEDAKLRAMYMGRQQQNILVVPGTPYGIVQNTNSPIINVMITGTAIAEFRNKQLFDLEMVPLTLAPCEVKSTKFFFKSGKRRVPRQLWVAYVPPAFYWDVSPDRSRSDLERYSSCLPEEWMGDGKATIIRTVPGGAIHFTHSGSGYEIIKGTARFFSQ